MQEILYFIRFLITYTAYCIQLECIGRCLNINFEEKVLIIDSRISNPIGSLEE